MLNVISFDLDCIGSFVLVFLVLTLHKYNTVFVPIL